MDPKIIYNNYSWIMNKRIISMTVEFAGSEASKLPGFESWF